jgi:N-acetyl-gamma-glutamyl-phosphate reductase
MKQTIKVGIIGGAGYTAGELIRILLHHPNVEIAFVNSSSHAGNKISDVHTDLIGETELRFCKVAKLFEGVNVIFFCSGHGETKLYLESFNVPENVKIIDLSNDYRDEKNSFVYGLPELNLLRIKSAQKIANPGCFATAIELALLPLANKGILEECHVTAITGSTGAGQNPTETTHFSWRNDNISVYKPFEHQHLSEIRQSLNQLQNGFNESINFVPIRGDFSRGIFAFVYTDFEYSIEIAKEMYNNFYMPAAFTFVVDKNPDLKQVVNTNKCIIYLEKHGDKLLIISMIDNLLKGASGQAVQNMNLMFGLDEKTGLNLKAVAF